LLNQLDGFSVNPRVMVCFSAPVDVSTLQTGIYIAPVGGGTAISINQIIVDPTNNCVFAKPNQVLNQDSQYLLVTTDSVHDSSGKKIKANDAFTDCLSSSDAYCKQLNQALGGIVQHPGSTNKVIAASLFTTMSATNWLEKARDFVNATELPLVLPAGIPTSFDLSQVKSINWIPAQSGLPPQNIPLSALSGVGKILFGLYLSPNFLNVSGPSAGAITVTPTNAPIAAPAGVIPLSFHLFLPVTEPPPAGFPVAIYGHGLSDNQFGAPTFIASTLAKNGFATLAIEITGHGYGAGSVVNLTDSQGVVHTVA